MKPSSTLDRKHPLNTPIPEWTNSWLIFETAAQLDYPAYLALTEGERKAYGWPASRDERIKYVQDKWATTTAQEAENE